VVVDPFCGCDTAIAVGGKLKRRSIGIDITHLAVTNGFHYWSAHGKKCGMVTNFSSEALRVF
jgi:site-specific DNA-methyltransferase (adenine-specific)